MKNTEEKLKKTEEYSKWLAEQLDELCISQSELAKSICKSQKTISRYVNGATLPSAWIRVAIDNYLEERSISGKFRHIPSKEFSDILLHLLEEFNVSQAELAKHIRKHQKNISNYIYGVEKADIKTQKDILYYFNYNSNSSVHFGTQVQLNYLLYGSNKELAAKYHFGERCAHSNAVAFLLSLPTSLQNIMLDNVSAFVDDTSTDSVIYCNEEITIHDDGSFINGIFQDDGTFLGATSYYDYGHYWDYKVCLELFNELPSHYKQVIRSELDKYARLAVPQQNEYDISFYDHILAYYNVIRYSVAHSKKRNEAFSVKETEENDNDKYIVAFENLLDIGELTEDEVIEEIKYKLDFDADDWHLWMLFVMYNRNGKGIECLENEMRRYVGLPETEKMNENLRYVSTGVTRIPPKNT